ncbi:putative transposable element encoded protein [Trachipleistophora hominis]|uniref:Putative transposable element encoded protein n=1 Tax=Trachipleistophora hominis TaxID=72359 RepID=L7JR47_TRAHO|nr:putative transposable element encoded protein [Trachipleistophora hominis]
MVERLSHTDRSVISRFMQVNLINSFLPSWEGCGCNTPFCCYEGAREGVARGGALISSTNQRPVAMTSSSKP